MTTALDASAVLALFLDEPRAEHVVDAIADDATMSTVNLGEVATTLEGRGIGLDPVLRDFREQVTVEPFTSDDALVVARTYPRVSKKGLSLGDRACLALAERLRAPALTADRVWSDLVLDVEVRSIGSSPR